MQFDKPLIIAGSGRSGTTWVVDALAEANGLRTVFEPLHPAVSGTGQKHAYRYILPGDREPELSVFMEQLVSGNYRSIWSDYRVRTDRLYPRPARFRSLDEFKLLVARWKKLARQRKQYRSVLGQRPIVKFIRANLMTGWLSAELGAHVVLVVRHPVPVIASKMRLGGEDWEPEGLLARYLEDARLVEDLPALSRLQLPRKLSMHQVHAILWCIENAPALQNSSQWGIYVAHYEELLTKTESWTVVVNWLGLPKRPSEERLRLPSQQAALEKAGSRFDARQLEQWAEYFSSGQLAEIQEILDLFGIRDYSVEQATPVID